MHFAPLAFVSSIIFSHPPTAAYHTANQNSVLLSKPARTRSTSFRSRGTEEML